MSMAWAFGSMGRLPAAEMDGEQRARGAPSRPGAMTSLHGPETRPGSSRRVRQVARRRRRRRRTPPPLADAKARFETSSAGVVRILWKAARAARPDGWVTSTSSTDVLSYEDAPIENVRARPPLTDVLPGEPASVSSLGRLILPHSKAAIGWPHWQQRQTVRTTLRCS